VSLERGVQWVGLVPDLTHQISPSGERKSGKTSIIIPWRKSHSQNNRINPLNLIRHTESAPLLFGLHLLEHQSLPVGIAYLFLLGGGGGSGSPKYLAGTKHTHGDETQSKSVSSPKLLPLHVEQSIETRGFNLISI